MPAYCEPGDLSLGGLSMPRFMTADQEIEKAADEINGHLGQIYVLPIVLDPLDPGQSADRLLLKVINSELATGSVVLASAGGGNDTQLQAYGSYLVRHARALLQRIISGEIQIDKAEFKAGNENISRGPVMVSKDAVSMVDSFYDPLYQNGTQPEIRGYLPYGRL